MVGDWAKEKLPVGARVKSRPDLWRWGHNLLRSVAVTKIETGGGDAARFYVVHVFTD
jgi:hypothetical protein